ncbi:MAG TPA: GntG family PLP-dependent aldolase [Cryomorphaceae bacterium]|nr:GntG family PLP-dependent aldolase [Cryomorphaceae bacterium]
MIDLRSDTVTVPTPGMREAMMAAPVGDDVFGEDPSINKLQEVAAEMFGCEAGLFCPSGTMTNQIAIQVHTNPGDEVICHEKSHVYNYEGGGIARNSLASTRLVHNNDAVMRPEEIADLMQDDHDWLARTSLVVAEDTSNRGGGKCYSFDELKAISEFCKQRNLAFHMDGARVFNAIVKKGHNPVEYGRLFDSISICLSKGLGTPVGSLLLGPKEFIRESRRVRKVMGGGMRQGGFLAGAGLYALEHHIARLSEDHIRAKVLADALTSMPSVKNVVDPETNILLFDVSSEKGSNYYLGVLEKAGLRGVSFGKNRIRLVTHLNIDDDDIDRSIDILHSVFK